MILYVNNYKFQANNENYSYSYQFIDASIFHRQQYCIRYADGSLVFCIPDSLLSLAKFPPIITLYI